MRFPEPAAADVGPVYSSSGSRWFCCLLVCLVVALDCCCTSMLESKLGLFVKQFQATNIIYTAAGEHGCSGACMA